MSWSKSSFRFFHKILQKNPNKLFGQPNIIDMLREKINETIHNALLKPNKAEKGERGRKEMKTQGQ